MGRKIQIIYFAGCPIFEDVKNALIEADIDDFELIKQDDLPSGNRFRKFSSPSILINNELVFGSRTDHSSCSMGKPSIKDLKERLAALSS